MQVQVKTNVLAKNDAIAEALQQLFKEKNIFVFNLLGSPGAGKTSPFGGNPTRFKKRIIA